MANSPPANPPSGTWADLVPPVWVEPVELPDPLVGCGLLIIGVGPKPRPKPRLWKPGKLKVLPWVCVVSEAKSGLALPALLVRLALGVVDALLGLPKPEKLEKLGNQFAVLAVLVRVVLAVVVAVVAFVVLLDLVELVWVDVCEPTVVPELLVPELLL